MKEAMEAKLESQYFKIDDSIPVEAIMKLADKALKTGDDKKMIGTLADIHNFASSLTKGGNVYIHNPPKTITESSCIKYVREHGIGDYMNAMTFHATFCLLMQDKSAIEGLEANFKHIHGIWMMKELDEGDRLGAELMMILLADTVGFLRGYFNMPKSKAIENCRLHFENQCAIWECTNLGNNLIITPIGEYRFCDSCHKKLLETLPNANLCLELLAKGSKEMVVINTWEEFKDRLLPEFLQMMEDGLMLSGDVCCICGGKAVCTGTGYKPYCGSCMEFPRKVYKSSLKDGGQN